ncbi:MAG: DinB family protein [Ginsengibacter sp.]
MATAISKDFIEQSISRIRENTKRIAICLQEIHEEEIWNSPNDNSNSIGNLILHLCGNIRQYIVSALGEIEDIRVRDKEFLTKSGFTKAALFQQLSSTILEATEIIKEIDDYRLGRIYSVQGFQLSGVGIIIHVTEHYSYHTGQIAFWIKQIKNKDLRFYGDIDLNTKNKNL